jgi:hypothetical protein
MSPRYTAYLTCLSLWNKPLLTILLSQNLIISHTKLQTGWITVSWPLFTLCMQIWHLCTHYEWQTPLYLYLSEPTTQLLLQESRSMSIYCSNSLYTGEKSLQTKRDITLYKFLRLHHDNILSSHCLGLISQIYLTAETLTAAFSVGQVPHLGWYMISLVHLAITGTWGLTEEVKRTVEGRIEPQRNVACYYRNRTVDR